MASYVSLQWVHGTKSTVVRGIKNGYRPRNAIKGGNGSYRLAGERSKLNLIVEDDNGNRGLFNIYDQVMEQTGATRMSDGLLSEVREQLKEAKFYGDDYGNVTWDIKLRPHNKK